MERRGPVENAGTPNQPEHREEFCGKAKPFLIDKWEIVEAYRIVRTHGKAAGVDGQTIEEFSQELKGNLYKLWNRMSSGSYFPPPVRRTEILKAKGGTRPLGIPTVADRIAQTVIKRRMEPILEAIFDKDSYGYRPGRSAHDAIAQTRQRCWRRAWVVELDIKGYFDAIRHDLLWRAIERHITCSMTRLYLGRWLKAGVMHADGRQQAGDLGTPQGGVISPLLANLYLHYTFDHWIRRELPWVEFERYADDIVCHCATKGQADYLLRKLNERFAQCGLTLHTEKTRLIYCGTRTQRNWNGARVFDFLGYQFRPRSVRKPNGMIGTAYLPGISPRAVREIQATLRAWRFRSWTRWSLADLAGFWNARLRGWMNYYGRFAPSAMQGVLWRFDQHLTRWWARKYGIHRMKAQARLFALRAKTPGLFVHWV